jgi:hypothetical protein
MLNDNLAEVIVNKNVEISLEMVEEYEAFLAEKYIDSFGLLINKVHDYNFAFEAKLSIGSHPNLKAIAVVHYTTVSELITQDVAEKRVRDGWNLKSFSGLELGWQKAYDWLSEELQAIN